MPKKVHRCVNKVKGKGKSTSSAWAICNSRIGKGRKRKK